MKSHLNAAWVIWCCLQTLTHCATQPKINRAAMSERQINPLITYKSCNSTCIDAKITKTKNAQLAEGLLFLGNEYNAANPLIMTDNGDLVWSAPDADSGQNLHVQSLNGADVLTVFHVQYANLEKGFLYGSIRILDNTYNLLHEICPKLNISVYGGSPTCLGDAHEQRITSEGTLLITAYDIIPYDLRPLGGPKKGWLANSQFYELSIPDGKILYSWKSLDHVPLNQTKLTLSGSGAEDDNPFDYFHINSVQKVNGQYFINARHTWASYLIDPTDGSVVWEFNGYNGGDFGPLPAAPTGMDGQLFSFQHDATLRHVTDSSVIVDMFNNDNYDQYDAPYVSTGFSFQLDLKDKSSKLLEDYHDTKDPVHSGQEGSFQRFSNGNVLIGYGNPPIVHEFGANQTAPLMVFDYGPGPRGGSYRVYRAPWKGYPTTKPKMAIIKRTGYVSWNGATEVAKWVVKSRSGHHVTSSLTVQKAGFETSFQLPSAAKKGQQVQAIAYDQHGKELGKTHSVEIS